jgi:hypothetical protein
MLLQLYIISTLVINLVSLSVVSSLEDTSSVIKNEEKDLCNPLMHCEANDIPMDIAEEINEITDVDTYMTKLVDIDSASMALTRGNRTRRDVTTGLQPKPATCQPMPTVVNLRPENDKDPTTIYFPSCTVLNRCGGCCTHKLLSCSPIEEELITFSIMKSQYVAGSKKLQSRGKVTINVPEHKKCKCQCSITEKDCNRLQVYDKSQCQCKCSNTSDQEKCIQESKIKLWDNNECTCLCREQRECSTGYEFDSSTCSCVEITDFESHFSDTSHDIQYDDYTNYHKYLTGEN